MGEKNICISCYTIWDKFVDCWSHTDQDIKGILRWSLETCLNEIIKIWSSKYCLVSLGYMVRACVLFAIYYRRIFIISTVFCFFEHTNRQHLIGHPTRIIVAANSFEVEWLRGFYFRVWYSLLWSYTKIKRCFVKYTWLSVLSYILGSFVPNAQ